MNISLNDTFDNISFYVSTNNLKCCDINGSPKDCNDDVILKQIQSQIHFSTIDDFSKISLDDTQFLAEFDFDCNNDYNKQFNNQLTNQISTQEINETNLKDTEVQISTESNEPEESSPNLSITKHWHESVSSKTASSYDEEDYVPQICGTIEAKDKSVKSTDIPTSKNLNEWGLPQVILEKYATHKVMSMFDWQAQCLSNPLVLKERKNLVYSAPTSAGKTLVSEILAIKTVLEMKRKVLVVLPFVSVVREKMFYFQDILSTSGIRVEGFMGSYNPPGGFHSVHIAICTIEKANSIINRLLEEKHLDQIGAIVVDEMHLLSDTSRGYQLELLLTKLKYMTQKDENVNIQIIGMSATLPNLNVLAKWLNAELFITDFRPVPLKEQCYCNGEIYDTNLTLLRKLDKIDELEMDSDNILQLCLETIFDSCSVLIFCPTKNWCESLSQQIAMAFWKICNAKTELSEKLLKQLKGELILEVLQQLKGSPVGLDKQLESVISFAVSFHHAGLTMDERDIIEGAFKRNVIRVLVATSTLSSGVNLPARRVIIRTPLFHGKPIDPLIYRQMIGRAGRMGKDSSGESMLICQKKDYAIAKELMSAKLPAIESCLEGSGRLKRALLEIISSEVASTPADIAIFAASTLQAANNDMTDSISTTIEYLIENEFIRLQNMDDKNSMYLPTPLGKACLASSMPPEEGLILFNELQKARQCFVLDTELHVIYLVTPYSVCYQWPNLNWLTYLDMWEKLSSSMKRVGELVGISEFFLINQARGTMPSNNSKIHKKIDIHKRFYTALALQDLVNEVPLNDVAKKFNCNRGLLQSLQQSASSFAGMVTTFAHQLGWSTVEVLVSQFQDRLQFGISRDLLDLMRLPILDAPKARALYNNGIDTLRALATSDIQTLENILFKSTPFESNKVMDGENEFDAEKRNRMRNIWLIGQNGTTVREAAEVMINTARKYLEHEMGIIGVQWEKNPDSSVSMVVHDACDRKCEDLEGENVIASIVPKNISLSYRNKINNHSTPNKIVQSPIELDSVHVTSTENNSLFSEYDSFDKAINIESTVNETKKSLSLNEVIRDSGYELNNLSGDLFDAADVNQKVDNAVGKVNTSYNKTIDDEDFLRSIATAVKNIDIACKNTSSLNLSDVINNSQSPLKLKTSNKRQRLSLGDETCKTPTKKPKRKKYNISNVITENGLNVQIPEEVPTVKRFNNFASMEIIDVCADEELFNKFSNEILTQKSVSCSLACRKSQAITRIGLRNANSESKAKFSHNEVQLEGVSFCWGENVSYYLSLNRVVSSTKIIKFLTNIFQNRHILMRIFDCKEQIRTLKNCINVCISCDVEDPKVAAWILEPDTEKHFASMILTYFREGMNLAEMVGNTKTNGSIGLELDSAIEPRIRSSIEAVLIYHTTDCIKEQFQQNLSHSSIFKLEMDSIICLSKMELHGFKVDVERMKALADTMKEAGHKLMRKAYEIVGRRFSFTSSKEISKIIGIYNGKKVSTSKQVLEDIDHPVAKLILQWRKLNCTLTKMIYPLLRMIVNERVHCNCITFNSTGRVSMHEPNLQNVPKDFDVRDPFDSTKTMTISCRSTLIASPDCILMSADYCQLELRLLTHFSQDEVLRSVMRKTEVDVFKLIAAKWNNVSVDDVDDKMRQNAKQICYGIIYGMGTRALAEQLNVTVEVAEKFIESFHEKYAGLRRYVESTIEKCRACGYVETIIGRRRYLPRINHTDNAVKKQAERQAVNTTIQGSAADIAKNAMTMIEKNINVFLKRKPRLILQLHDELIYDVPIKYKARFAEVLKNCMENSVDLTVPFPVKLKIGHTWGTLEEYYI